MNLAPAETKMNNFRVVPIDLKNLEHKSYDIVIGENILADIGAIIKARLGQKRIVIITDSNVNPLYGQRALAALVSAGHKVLTTVTIPAGEASKSFSSLQSILDQMLASGLDRQALVLALGGGVVGDLAGFAASICLRGIDSVQIPTTLVAQVDSSVGGKTGINAAYGKNVVGTFYQPRLVVVDVALLDSLPPRELVAGYAEVVKYGLIKDVEFFRWCEANGSALLAGDRQAQIYAVSECCMHKARIVAADEREKGERALLNFGHTFGHALEAALGYDQRLLHGEAVAIGMVMALAFSVKLDLCREEDLNLVTKHFAAVHLPMKPTFVSKKQIDELMQYMAQDKKAEAGKLTLILTRGIGRAFVRREVEALLVSDIWQQFLDD